MKYIFEINLDFDGDAGLDYIPKEMYSYDQGETYHLRLCFEDPNKAKDTVNRICSFISQNIHGRDRIIDELKSTINTFVTAIHEADLIDNPHFYCGSYMSGNQDNTSFEFSVQPHTVCGVSITDEEYKLIKENKQEITQDELRTVIVKLYKGEFNELLRN